MTPFHRQAVFVAALSAAALGVATAASAQSQPGYYVSGAGGVSLLPNLQLKSAGTTSHEHYDTGYAYGGAVGYDMAPARALNSTRCIKCPTS